MFSGEDGLGNNFSLGNLDFDDAFGGSVAAPYDLGRDFLGAEAATPQGSSWPPLEGGGGGGAFGSPRASDGGTEGAPGKPDQVTARRWSIRSSGSDGLPPRPESPSGAGGSSSGGGGGDGGGGSGASPMAEQQQRTLEAAERAKWKTWVVEACEMERARRVRALAEIQASEDAERRVRREWAAAAIAAEHRDRTQQQFVAAMANSMWYHELLSSQAADAFER